MAFVGELVDVTVEMGTDHPALRRLGVGLRASADEGVPLAHLCGNKQVHWVGYTDSSASRRAKHR